MRSVIPDAVYEGVPLIVLLIIIWFVVIQKDEISKWLSAKLKEKREIKEQESRLRKKNLKSDLSGNTGKKDNSEGY